MNKTKRELKSRILRFTKTRNQAKDKVSTTEATRNLFTDIWKQSVDDVQAKAEEFKGKKLIKKASKKEKGFSVG